MWTKWVDKLKGKNHVEYMYIINISESKEINNLLIIIICSST